VLSKISPVPAEADRLRVILFEIVAFFIIHGFLATAAGWFWLAFQSQQTIITQQDMHLYRPAAFWSLNHTQRKGMYSVVHY